jgi:phosphate starvation-inducible protein PhoH
MVTKRKSPALFVADAIQQGAENKYNGLNKRADALENDERKHQHQVGTNALKLKLDHLKTFDPLTPNQEAFFKAYKAGDYFIGMFGSAGTGKTFCSMYRAIEEAMDKGNSFKRVVVVRSCVQTRDVGFLPGSLEEKGEIYELPYKEIAATLFDRPDAWDRLKEQGHARFISTTAIRGISIDDAIVVVDECQNMSFQELNTIITRVGYRSKIIFVGDWKQNDLVKSKYDTSGLLEFLNVARKMNEFTEFTFTRDDIVRSSLVKSWVIACEETGL